DYEANTDAFLKKLSEDFSKEFVNETKTHIKDEYSTFDWILQGMIERAGFKIERTYTEDILSSEYFCRKNKSFGSSLKNV
ncbi:MAG: hypothetical protein GWN61_11335, partial [candidate division Zixibacteria bacterium]|nr:hypothetical protein [candidate division Zixibacteria bacterium]NIR64794.1 hypothetical protein [candidate division Zixibacteria bacterium]NIS46622.1 hypothetical protein [candidate division Zixibacteria bacterium]NIU14264.1 hypothetical protein [candidate division Zixibacteria bacterium]NIV06744.1 hypothetical protein [candidate division Zixibacteria bacterium]